MYMCVLACSAVCFNSCWCNVTSTACSCFLLIIIFYCGLMIHIIDTRAQKVARYTSAYITETVFAYDQHWEEQSNFILTTAVSSFAKAQKMDNHTVVHHTTGVSSCPTLRGPKHFPALLIFLCLMCTQCPHNFTAQKKYWWDANTETTHEQLLHSVSTIQECWIIEEKWRFVKIIRKRFVKSIRHFLQPHFTPWLSARTLQCLFVWGRVAPKRLA